MTELRNLRFEVTGSIATIVIDRPDRLNALDAETFDELEAAVASVRDDPGIAGAVVTGGGSRAFVAGADIGELARLGAIEALEASRRGQRVFRAIELSRKPFVAAVNGLALGGGCELALACHLRVAASTAGFGLPEVKLGAIPGYGGTVRLPRIVGKGVALEMILTGRMIDAKEAHRLGLVNRVVEPGTLLEESRALLRTILDNGPVAVEMAIESVTRGLETSVEAALALEATLFGALAATDDMREGMTAFLEKRKPSFRGR